MSADTWLPVATGEQAAAYAYGVLAPRLSGGERTRAINAIATHEQARDDALAQLAEQPDLDAVFQIPFPVTNAEQARRLAALCEDRLVNVYCTLAATQTTETRKDFIESARRCSARAVSWGQRPESFPGTGEPIMKAIGEGQDTPATAEDEPSDSPTPVESATPSPPESSGDTGGDGAQLQN